MICLSVFRPLRSREEERRFTYEDLQQQDQYGDVHYGDVPLQDIHHHGWNVSQQRTRKTPINMLIMNPAGAVSQQQKKS